MLIPGYFDTRVPCGLPGFRPGSRKTSDLPALALLDAELQHRLNAATADAVHNRALIDAHCHARHAVVYNILVILLNNQ